LFSGDTHIENDEIGRDRISMSEKIRQPLIIMNLMPTHNEFPYEIGIVGGYDAVLARKNHRK
jgi:hypothetical protein